MVLGVARAGTLVSLTLFRCLVLVLHFVLLAARVAWWDPTPLYQ